MFVFKAAVVGAGAMGGQIAQTIASAGFPVVLKDINQDLVQAGLDEARKVTEGQVSKLVSKERITAEQGAAQIEEILGRIHGATSYEGFGDVDFVIEAVPERMAVKQAVFAELDAVTPGHAILASNTSSLSIAEIGEATLRPDKVVGFHYFYPASVMALVEIVEGEETSPETVTAALTFAQAIRKQPIACFDSPGFVVNRILDAGSSDAPDEQEDESWLSTFVEACLVLQEGIATHRDIDFGMMAGAGLDPRRGLMPPFMKADAEGLDSVLERLQQAAERHGERFAPPTILRRLIAQGRLGQKSGQGFYAYPQPDAASSPEGEQPGEVVKLETWREAAPGAEQTGGEGVRCPEGVAIAWLANGQMNSISPQVIEDLGKVWQAAKDANVRALVIASSNPFLFSAGADIKAFTSMDEGAGAQLIHAAHALLRELGSDGIATIAAVNGLAFGGGCELAMACDVRVAARSATFGQPEIKLGIIPGFGGTQRLPRLIGENKALEMNLLGDPIMAEEAFELGLVNRMVEDHELLDTALAWARKLASQAPIALEQIKQIGGAHPPGDLDEGIEAEKRGFARAFASADAKEGIASFLGKRAPRFQGR
jgi:3-hydroxyacyl-CoA dehydrogenase/enoyl-CoA hydratase/carnithine racemase